MANGKWTVRRSSTAFRTPWFSVRSEDCTSSRGVDIAPYYTLDFPDFVHVLATSRNHVILVRQYRHGYGSSSLELPGGVMDPGESDVVAVGARELREETGYGSGQWSRIVTLSIDPARYSNRLHLIRADDVIAGAANPDLTEDIETILVSRADAIGYARSGEIVNAAHAAMLLIGLT